MDINSHTLIPLFMPGSVHNGLTSRDDCGWMFPDKFRVSSFPVASHTMPGQWHSQPTQLRWVKGVCMFWCNPPPALLAEWLGSFMCHCGNMGVERTPNKKHTKLTLEKKILLPLLPGFKHNLSITSPARLPTSYPSSLFKTTLNIKWNWL